MNQLFGGKANLSRDIPNGDYHAVEQKAKVIWARLRGNGFDLDVEILVPDYNKKNYGGENCPIASHYTSLVHGIDYLDRLALAEDSRTRAAVSRRIVTPHGIKLDKKTANDLFDKFASAEDEGF